MFFVGLKTLFKELQNQFYEFNPFLAYVVIF